MGGEGRSGGDGRGQGGMEKEGTGGEGSVVESKKSLK